MGLESDDGGRGNGSSPATSASEPLVANVSGRGGCRATAERRKRRCRGRREAGRGHPSAPDRARAGLVRRSLLSDALSAFCGVWSRSWRARVGDIVGAGDSNLRNHGRPNRVG